MMKRTVIALLCIGLLCAAAPRSAFAAEKKPPLQVLVAMGTQKGGPTVTFTIVNSSKTYQLVQGYSCSWQVFWQTDDKSARIVGPGECFSNVRSTVILAPGQRYVGPTHPMQWQGTPGRHALRFGYIRPRSTFTSTELKKIYHSKEKNSMMYSRSFTSHFKARAGQETFWSAPITVEVSRPLILH